MKPEKYYDTPCKICIVGLADDMKEGGQLTRQSALVRSGDVINETLSEETAEMAGGEDSRMEMYLSESVVACYNERCVVMINGRRYIHGLVDKHGHLLKSTTIGLL